MAMDDMPEPLPPRRPVEDFLVPPRSGQRLPRLSPPKIVGERKKVVSMSPDVKLSSIELGVAAPPQSSMSEAVCEAVRDMHVADHDAQVEQLRDTLHQHAVETALFFSALGGEAKIGPSEFRAAVARLKWGVSDSVCDVLFRAMDSDGSGDGSGDGSPPASTRVGCCATRFDARRAAQCNSLSKWIRMGTARWRGGSSAAQWGQYTCLYPTARSSTSSLMRSMSSA